MMTFLQEVPGALLTTMFFFVLMRFYQITVLSIFTADTHRIQKHSFSSIESVVKVTHLLIMI